MPWKPMENNISSQIFSIPTTPYSNYSIISSQSFAKTPESCNLNKAFYVFSSQTKKTPISQQKAVFNQNAGFNDTMTVTQKEELLLRLYTGGSYDNDELLTRNEVKLEDILNVSKNISNSSMDCEFLKGVNPYPHENHQKPKDSLEKLLKTLNFTGKLSENSLLLTLSKKINESNSLLASQNIVKNLNREIYQHLDAINLQNSLKNGFFNKNPNPKSKVPKLNLEKIKKNDNSHSFSPSYRKNAERSQYFKEIFNKEKQPKKIKNTNKSMDFANNPSKNIDFSVLQSRMNEKTSSFLRNLKKHAKNNLSLIENPHPAIKIKELFSKNKQNEEKICVFNEKTNYLNIMAPANNINVYINNNGDYDEKQGFHSNDNGVKRPKGRSSLMKLLSQVNQGRKEGRILKENMENNGKSIEDFKDLQKKKNQEYKDKSFY